jgi:competence protein ComEA
MSPADKDNTPTAHGQLVDLNTASKKDLAALPGIGPDYAQTIMEARSFKSKQDLLATKVIPQAAYDKIQNLVTTQGSTRQSLPE